MFSSVSNDILLLIASIVFAVLIGIILFKRTRRDLAMYEEELKEAKLSPPEPEAEEEDELPLPEPIAKNARVVEKRFESDVIGTKSVKQVSSFYVTFFTEDGETVEHAVPQELFLSIEKGQESTLITIDGQFFDFGDGEEVAAAEEA